MINKLIIDGKEIELSDDTVKNLKKTLGLNINTYDKYSEFIGRYNASLCVKGREKMLKSSGGGTSLIFDNDNREIYDDILSGSLVMTSDLKEGDVVCLAPNLEKNTIENFGIYIGKEENTHYRFQRIIISDIEYITCYALIEREVFRFDRG